MFRVKYYFILGTVFGSLISFLVSFLVIFLNNHNQLVWSSSPFQHFQIPLSFQRNLDRNSPDNNSHSLHEKTTSEKTPKSKVLIIYWTKIFIYDIPVNVNPGFFPYFYVDARCPMCELTTDKKRVGEASALVIHSRNIDEMPPKQYKNITWIFHSLDDPVYTPAFRNPEIMAQFNYSVTYRLDSDFPCPEFRKPELDTPVPFSEKTGLVSFSTTNCEWLRTEYVRRLMKFIKVDSYGKCLKNKEGLRERYNQSYEHACREVRELQRYYKFSLIFPHSDCDYYLTEKLYMAMSAGTVPVFMGTDKIDEVLQWGNLKHSVIKVKDFATPKKLAEYLHYLAGNETEYNTYLKWKYEGFQFPKEYYDSPIGVWWDGPPLYCRICMRIAKDPKGHSGLPVEKCDGHQARTVKKWLKKTG